MGEYKILALNMASSKCLFLLGFLGICLVATVVQSAPAMDVEAEPEAPKMFELRGTGSCSSKWTCGGFLCTRPYCKLTSNNCNPRSHADAFYSFGTCECTCYRP